MKRFLLPLFVLVALVLIASLVWIQNRGARPGADSVPAQTPEAARTSASLEPATGELAAPGTLSANVERANATAGIGTHPDDGRVLEGEVRAPSECVVDTQVEVFALARPSDLDTLMNAVLPRRGDERSGPDVDARLVVARTKLDASGRFRLTLPRDARKAHVILSGRSWYLPETITFELGEPQAFAALQAECGGWIAGRIDVPPEAGSVAALDGEITQLSPSLTSLGGGPGRMAAAFRRTERRALVKDGVFELTALDPTLSYRLDFTTQAFADASIEVAEVARGRATPLDLHLELGGSVVGRVLAADGSPIAGATVEANLARGPFGLAERIVRQATTSAAGTYELLAVAPGSVQVSARAKGGAASEARQVDVTDRVRVTGIDLQLGSGEAIAGIVRWPDGTPAVGAEVRASAVGGQAFGPGAFRAQRRGEEPRGVADASGRFVVNGLAAGEYTVSVEALKPEDLAKLDPKDAEGRRRSAWRARANGVKSGTSDSILTLGAPLVVRGVVKQPDGSPVTAFRVQSSSADAGGRRGGGGMNFAFGGQQRQNQDVSDERGEFTFTFVREGSYKLTISADGFVTSEPIEVTVPVAADLEPLAIVLARGAVVRGTVRSPLGTPVANATVAPASATPGPFAFAPGGAGAETIKARTDAQGRFTLSELRAGRLVLSAESNAWAKSDELSLDLAAGEIVPDAVLLLRTGGTITGESYEDGRPTPGRNVTAMDLRTFESHNARTDAAGRFRIEHVPAGAWRVTALPSAGDVEAMGRAPRGGGDGGMGAMFSRMKSVNADVVDGAETHVVLGAPPEAPVAVRGKVTQGGEGVAGLRLAFLGQGDSFGPGMKSAQTAADGTYAIQLDRPGDYSITAQTGGRGASLVEFVETVRALPEVVIDLALPDARLSGRVRTPEGEPASGVRVSVFPAALGVGGSMMGGGFSEVMTDENGEFDVKSLRAGTYSLTIGGTGVGGFRGFGSAADPRYARKTVEDVQLAESEWRKGYDVRLEPALGVDVEVVDERGGPIGGATVFARDEAGRAVDRMSASRTDSNGKARYTGLAQAAYTFSARKDGLASGETPKVDVRPSGTQTIKIVLAAGTNLLVTTVDANDAPLRARVRVVDEAGRDVAGLMSAQDLLERATRGGPGGNEQKIGPLAPGTYKVTATTTDGKSVEKAVTLTGEPERRVTLAFGG